MILREQLQRSAPQFDWRAVHRVIDQGIAQHDSALVEIVAKAAAIKTVELYIDAHPEIVEQLKGKAPERVHVRGVRLAGGGITKKHLTGASHIAVKGSGGRIDVGVICGNKLMALAVVCPTPGCREVSAGNLIQHEDAGNAINFAGRKYVAEPSGAMLIVQL